MGRYGNRAGAVNMRRTRCFEHRRENLIKTCYPIRLSADGSGQDVSTAAADDGDSSQFGIASTFTSVPSNQLRGRGSTGTRTPFWTIALGIVSNPLFRTNHRYLTATLAESPAEWNGAHLSAPQLRHCVVNPLKVILRCGEGAKDGRVEYALRFEKHDTDCLSVRQCRAVRALPPQ